MKEAQTTYQTAQLNYYSALYQYNSAKSALEKAIGKNLTNASEEIELDVEDETKASIEDDVIKQ